MKRRMPQIVSIMFLAVFAAMAQPNSAEQTAPMKALQYMTGEWKGEGWIAARSGRSTAAVTEKAECKLDCSIIVFQGLGVKTDSVTKATTVVHDAFGVISYDAQKGKYMLRAYKKEGIVDAELDFIGEKVFQWKFATPSGGMVRFTVDFSVPDKWKETGEFSRDGTTWMKSLMLELDRVSVR